jgi:cation:H+ antiporter
MIAGLIILIIVSSFVLIKAADITVSSVSRLSHATHASPFFLSAIVLALGTSLPELFVAITSSLDGTPNLSLGNVIGANITNLALVSGVSAVLFARVKVQGNILKKDLGVTMFAGIVPFLLIFDRELSRVDGLILLSVYGVYATSLFRVRYMEIAKEQSESQENAINKIIRQTIVVGKHNYQNIGKLFLGIALLLASAEAIVRIANQTADILGVPVFLVGLILVSFGTTLPEMAFSIRSLGEHHPTMFFGNLLGSIIANSTLVVGVAAIIAPIQVVALSNYSIAFVMFIVSIILFWMFTKTKRALVRWEGLVLILLYIGFVIVEFS